MSKQDTGRYKALISGAKQCEYYATCPTNCLPPESRQRWAQKAKDMRAEAEALPDDFVDPECDWRMPEWGTYGT